jgi:hypothetical protein
MFSISRVNVIESDEGFSVEVLWPDGLLYKEGNKTLHIESELVIGPAGLGIYTNSIQTWDAPDNSKVIDKRKRESIVDNVRRAFRFRGFEIEVV